MFRRKFSSPSSGSKISGPKASVLQVVMQNSEPEYWDAMFLRNVGLYTDYTALSQKKAAFITTAVRTRGPGTYAGCLMAPASRFGEEGNRRCIIGCAVKCPALCCYVAARKIVSIALSMWLQFSDFWCEILWTRCKIWGFHGGDYEEWCLLGCYVVWLL
jgi:hypothetical protein